MPAGSGEGSLGLVRSGVEPERRVLVPHERGVRGDPPAPAAEPHDEVEDGARVATGDGERDTGDQAEDADQAAAVPRPGATGEHGDDEVLRDGEQPPLDPHQAPGEALWVLHVEPGGIVSNVMEREGRVHIGPEGEGVELDAPRPPQDPDVEVEDAPWVAAREGDGDARHDGQDGERQPQGDEHDQVWDGEEPLDQPAPAAELGVELALDHHRIAGCRESSHGNLLPSRCLGSPGHQGPRSCRARTEGALRTRHRRVAKGFHPAATSAAGALGRLS